MYNHTVDLVGRPFHASIGEPWDFESDAGQNRLVGVIQRMALDKTGNVLLICDVIPFMASGKKVTSVVAVNRYNRSQNPVDVLKMSGSATMNFMFKRSGEIFSVEDIEQALLREDSCSFLVGSMKLGELETPLTT